MHGCVDASAIWGERVGSCLDAFRGSVPLVEESDADRLPGAKRNEIDEQGVAAMNAAKPRAVRAPRQRIGAVFGNDGEELQVGAARDRANVEDVHRQPFTLWPKVGAECRA